MIHLGIVRFNFVWFQDKVSMGIIVMVLMLKTYIHIYFQFIYDVFPLWLQISSAAWEIYIVQSNSHVHLSESPDTLIPLQTGLCGGSKRISIIPFLFCPGHKFIS